MFFASRQMAVPRARGRAVKRAAFWLVIGLALGGFIYAFFFRGISEAPHAAQAAGTLSVPASHAQHDGTLSVPKATLSVAVVSWYGQGFHGRRMANGRVFDQYDPTVVAHKTLPFGTRVRLTNPDTGTSLVVTVQDRGPYVADRDFDVSRAAAERLGLIGPGVKALRAETLDW